MAEEVVVESHFYLDKIIGEIEDANPEAAMVIAERIAERAKDNIRNNGQIDTGFMVNSVFVMGNTRSSYDQANSEAKSAAPDREMAPEPTMDEDALAGVGVGALYAIYQEIANPFLFPAAQVASAELGGVVKAVFEEMVQGEDGTMVPTGRKVVR